MESQTQTLHIQEAERRIPGKMVEQEDPTKTTREHSHQCNPENDPGNVKTTHYS